MDSVGFCTTATSSPSFFKIPYTAAQPDPSTKPPWTRTMFLIAEPSVAGMGISSNAQAWKGLRAAARDVNLLLFRSERGELFLPERGASDAPAALGSLG